MPYDIFISYSRRDNSGGRVTELKERIEADYRAFAGEDLTCFFDRDDIHGMDDWRHRILDGLRQSSLLLLVLSPTYIASPYCEWEVIEYLKYEHSRAAQGQGLAPVYFVEIPGPRSPDFPAQEAAWLAQVRRRNRFDLRPWHEEGAAALKRLDVRNRLEDLERTLHERLSKLRRLADASGNLPAHNPRFVGRELEMQHLHESAGLGRFGVLTALQGMGGLGKTALAIQYACAYADFYPGGRWLLGCAGRTRLAGVLRELDVDLGIQLTEDERRDDRRAAKRILAELETRAREGAAARAGEKVPPEPRALLLLDNVDDPSLLQPPESDLLTGKRWLHVLATTRIAPDALGHDPERQTLLTVDELPPEDALRLIESYQPGGRFPNAVERTAAAEIVRRLGGFTLAVEVVAVYLGECAGRVTCAALLQRLDHEGFQGVEGIAQSTKGGIRHVEKLLGATLGPTLDLLAPAESLVLAFAALLPPDSIPLPWLRTLVGEDYSDLTRDAAPGYSDPWLDLVNRLLGLRLLQIVDVDPQSQAPRLVRMHRLVGELVKQRRKWDQNRRRAELASHVKARSNALQTIWHEHQWEISPLIASAQDLLERHDPKAPTVVRSLCQWLPHFDSGRQSEPLLRACLAQLEERPSDDPLDLSVALSNLGWALQKLGRYQEAETHLRRALAIDEASTPPDEGALAVRCNQLESCLRFLGKIAEAEPFTRRALDLAERAFGATHRDTLTCLHNLACSLQDQGDLAAAEPLHRRALASREQALGPAHPDTLFSVNGLALLLLDAGRFTEAEPLLRRSMDGRRDAYGAVHPATANGVASYALGLMRLGRDQEADAYAREALAIWQQTQVPEDLRSGKAHWVLGVIAKHRGDLGQAITHLQQALRLLRLGNAEDHPWVKEVRDELDRATRMQ
ncbi:tetratricopeptide repeat protein [uncultured Lamprocystis sp.]|jgi:tetratricopeptide (TPR) repeat protein|uniref:tetratricopeptide repeat protein n=1 Tax=uncultured Lamprocystis sp. TaxID=543132 RepID=UPI0025D00951|nr:tetratricopeptide repeat protein [uncultured Lamprocystis sp.]